MSLGSGTPKLYEKWKWYKVTKFGNPCARSSDYFMSSKMFVAFIADSLLLLFIIYIYLLIKHKVVIINLKTNQG